MSHQKVNGPCLLRMQTYRPVTNPSHQCRNPKISVVITDENIDKSLTSTSESDLDADQDSDSEYQSQTVVNSLAPVDGRLFNSKKYEILYPWLYFSGNKNVFFPIAPYLEQKFPK